MATHFNITGASAAAAVLTRELLAAGSNTSVSRISFTNIHETHPCTVDLYIEKKLTGKFYLLKGVELPVGNTFVYNSVVLNNNAGEFGLYLKLNSSASEIPSVDIIIE
tara:strand:- start:198 stop:521 length:324 start_codon:yes stop_codon:yes gene_type:complete